MPRESTATYSKRFDRAVTWALRDFRAIIRKGSGVPYVTHLFAVTALVGEHGGDEDQLIAAMLHDWLEDIEGASSEALEDEFGPRVRAIVEALSDVIAIRPKPPWKDRKDAFLVRIRAEEPDVKLVCAADKLHNAQTLLRDLRSVGMSTLDRFNGGREGTLWYHSAVVPALAEGWSHPLLDELSATVTAIHSTCGLPAP